MSKHKSSSHSHHTKLKKEDLFLNSNKKKLLPFILGVFLLSIFIGVIISVFIKQWVLANNEVVLEVLRQKEAERLDILIYKEH